MKRKKAIIHLFESIFAAFIISGYFFFAFSSYEQPLVQKEMVTENRLQTEAYSFLSAIKYTNATYFIEEAQDGQLNAILKYFMGINRGFSLATDGLPRNEVKIGVVSMNFQLRATATHTCNFVPTINGAVCYGFTFDGKNIAIANLSSNETNALFINDGIIDWKFERALGEGPFLERTMVNISNEYYGFSINDTSKKVLLFKAEDTIKLTDKLSTHLFNESYSCLNNRNIEFNIRPASMEESYESLSKNDILFFYNYRDLTAYKEKLINFIDDEKALVEITDSSLSCDDVQTELFNLQPGYSRLGNDKNITINTESIDAEIGNYLMDRDIILKTKRYTPDLDFIAEEEDEELNDSIDVRTAFITKIGVNNTLWNIVLVRNGGVYSHAYFSDQTNFTGKPGNISRNVGEEISIGPYNYTIESIHPDGIFIKLRNVFEKFRFPDDAHMPFVYANPTQNIFRDDESFVILKQNRTYHITPYDIGENITNTTGFLDLTENQARARGIFCPGNATGYIATISNISLDPASPINSRVEVAVADCPNAYLQMDTFYVDHTNNSYFNDSFEGPFCVFDRNDVLRIDSEYYKIKILKPSGVFNLTLIKRWHVPAAIINDVDKKGVTLWMVDPQNSSDGWSVLRSTLAAFSNKKHHIILPMPSRRNSIFIEDLFFSKGDIFIPYTVKTGVWYP